MRGPKLAVCLLGLAWLSPAALGAGMSRPLLNLVG